MYRYINNTCLDCPIVAHCVKTPLPLIKKQLFWFRKQPPKVQRLKSITPLYLTPQNKKSNLFHSDFSKISTTL